MKKFMAVLAVSVSVGVFADATSYQALYWQVNSSAISSPLFKDVDYALLYAVADGNGTGAKISGGALASDFNTEQTTVLKGDGALFSWEPSALNDATKFYVELLDSNYSAVGRSAGGVTYEYLKKTGFLDITYSDSTPASTAKGVYSFGSFERVVPEPSSGLMLLFGLASLALRRRRA